MPIEPLIFALIEVALKIASNTDLLDALLKSDALTIEQKARIKEFRKKELSRLEELLGRPKDIPITPVK